MYASLVVHGPEQCIIHTRFDAKPVWDDRVVITYPSSIKAKYEKERKREREVWLIDFCKVVINVLFQQTINWTVHKNACTYIYYTVCLLELSVTAGRYVHNIIITLIEIHTVCSNIDQRWASHVGRYYGTYTAIDDTVSTI